MGEANEAQYEGMRPAEDAWPIYEADAMIAERGGNERFRRAGDRHQGHWKTLKQPHVDPTIDTAMLMSVPSLS